MTLTLDWEILDRYLAGTQTPEDLAYLSAWAEDNIERNRLLKGLKSGTLPTVSDRNEWNGLEMWEEFRKDPRAAAALNADSEPVRPLWVVRTGEFRRVSHRQNTDGNTVNGWKYRTALSWITAVVMLVAVGIVVGTGWEQGVPIRGFAFESDKEIITGRGQRTTIELSDGSRVLIAPESRLLISRDYGNSARRIEVEGEVYITSVPDPERPFIVKAGNTETRVLGTSFSVRKYPDDSVVRVAVIDGRVTVGEAVVGAGDVARTLSTGVTTVQAELNIGKYVSWSKGILVFDDRSLSEVVKELNRVYGVEIVLSEKELGDEKITATFDNQTTSSILRYLSLALDLDLRYAGETAILSNR